MLLPGKGSRLCAGRLEGQPRPPGNQDEIEIFDSSGADLLSADRLFIVESARGSISVERDHR